MRELRSAPGAWLAGIARPGRERLRVDGGIEVASPSTFVPGHRGRMAEAVEAHLLQRVLPRGLGAGTVVVMAPWHWPAVTGLRGMRRVFECTDDWSRLFPAVEPARLSSLYRRIAREADAVVLVSEHLSEAFAGGITVVIPNAVGPELLHAPRVTSAVPRRMVYVGTLSERFDAPLVARVLDRLPGWELHLYGQCRYRASAGAPAPELSSLLAGAGGRAVWHGPIERSQLPAAMDAAAVLISPHRTEFLAGQDSMKMYDYAARGRPIVTTGTDVRPDTCPRVEVASGPENFAAAVLRSQQEPPGWAPERREWAMSQTWEARWPAWKQVLFGNA